MTVTLYEALRAMDVVRGYVVLDHIGRGETGRAKHEENVVKRLMERVCRKAGLLLDQRQVVVGQILLFELESDCPGPAVTELLLEQLLVLADAKRQ